VIGEGAEFNNCFSPRDAREATVVVGHLTKGRTQRADERVVFLSRRVLLPERGAVLFVET
jgi:hypothetical protein